MRSDYKAAKKLGDSRVKAAAKSGKTLYLTALSSINDIKDIESRIELGNVMIPLQQVAGFVGVGSKYSTDLMPVAEEQSELAEKWQEVCSSCREIGMRQPVEVFEYMNRFYVADGMKRLSVQAFLGAEFVPAYVTRLMPVKSGSEEMTVYSEFLNFFDVTGIYSIVFSKPGDYERLARLLGQDLTDAWPAQLCYDLELAFAYFKKKGVALNKMIQGVTAADAFLVYISIFPMTSLFEDTTEQVSKNIQTARNEFFTGAAGSSVTFLDSAPAADKPQKLTKGLFSSGTKYTESSPLKVGFVYNAGIEDSRWINSHDAGRIYISGALGKNVVTKSYVAEKGDIATAIYHAVRDKNSVIFTVTSDMLENTVAEAAKHPEVKFLNCSLAQEHNRVRAYHGKLYEAAFLMGILAADDLLTRGGESRIGYVVRGTDSLSIADLNAFAVGVEMLAPECSVVLKYADGGDDDRLREGFRSEGISVYADIEYTESGTSGAYAEKPGVYRLTDDGAAFLGAPYFKWGRFYAQIVGSVLDGTYDIKELISSHTAANYWFGLSAGVVDIRTGKLPYQTKKLLSFFKNAVIEGGVDPFSGEIRSQGDILQSEQTYRDRRIPLIESRLDTGRIASISWLNGNISGALPTSG